MMKTKDLLIGAAAGTAAMTVFSYFLSGKKSKDFREPALLAKMIRRAFPETEKTFSEAAGWMLHSGFGLFFAFLSNKMIKKMQSEDLANNIVAGTVNGIAGVIAWKATFSLHPDPPKIHFHQFYQHLILAHIIFTITALSVMDRDDDKTINSKPTNFTDF